MLFVCLQEIDPELVDQDKIVNEDLGDDSKLNCELLHCPPVYYWRVIV